MALPFPLSGTFFDGRKVFSSAFVQGHWVGLAEQRLLWLSPEYRQMCKAVCGNVVCTGHFSGHINFLKFNSDDILKHGN